MNKAYLGIDLGTSSVKVILKDENGNTQKARESYGEISPKGWSDALIKALSSISYPGKVAIGLSSQVGTYIVNKKEVISWNSPLGAFEADEVLNSYKPETFMAEISMMHPKIVSYPIPRLRHIEKTYGKGADVCQPKDFIGELLTGEYKTDKFSWRGLANTEKGAYSKFFLKEAGSPKLPPIIDYTRKLGTVREEICRLTKIPDGTPVYTGLNDFYASLVGMGVGKKGDMFDITGTSEHLGIITESPAEKTSMVSSPFIKNFVHYGVTASSGASLDFAISNFGLDNVFLCDELIQNAPVFLPYLSGERAPVFDNDARGVFFGINADCRKEHLSYSVMEGVVFSIFHIYEHLGFPPASAMTVSGGAAKNELLSYLKAEIFNLPVNILEESDTSALGALIVAASESGSSAEFVKIKKVIAPDGKFRALMMKRYQIYKKLYPNLKDSFKELREL